MAVQEMTRTGRGGALRAPAPPGAGGDPPPGGHDAADLAGRISRLSEGRGGVLLVEGAPGAGKSRLVREARTIAETLALRVMSGAGERGREGVPFGVLLRALGSGGRPVVDAGLLRTLSESVEQRFWLYRALREQLRQAALDRPLLVAIDDLQWCDDGTLHALRALPAGPSADAILWLVAVRTGARDAGVRSTVAELTEIGAHTSVDSVRIHLERAAR